jgi:ubiquinone biosynthesis protein
MIRLLRPLLAPAVRRALRSRFSSPDIHGVLDEAFDDYERQRSQLPKEKELGARLMVHFAALTAGFYRALFGRGVPDEEARRLTAEATWLVYDKMAAVPWVLARVAKRTPYDRLRLATELFRRFPFRAPSYDMVDVAAAANVVAFDVRRCPVAEYFEAQGLSQVCVDAWCSLDVPLAKKWGARLERTGTLAQGAERCDFRWRVEERR